MKKSVGIAYWGCNLVWYIEILPKSKFLHINLNLELGTGLETTQKTFYSIELIHKKHFGMKKSVGIASWSFDLV